MLMQHQLHSGKHFHFTFSLTFVPYVVLHLQKFMDAPAHTSWFALRDAVHSTTFLSAFVGIFQGVICLHRKVATRDHKLVEYLPFLYYWRKNLGRAELALYVSSTGWRFTVVALFCACMGGVMYYLEHEPDTMAPFLRVLIRRLLASRISNPVLPSNRVPSYTYLQTLDAIRSQNHRKAERMKPRLLRNIILNPFQGCNLLR
ncbi:hypothetical protein NC653_028497 [Populus alba x Populus x berolinensis]|uniref:Uncharacterized protein n=1 Tax=Populus alba x Populus x berolinensis TaxID=444605 RepID=A0AAD6Q471_9ROSI|nr:hypothetical protein NC653_028497 [Populus alba x Populus x berolinensis]